MMCKNPGNEIRDALQAVHDAAANYYRVVRNNHCDDDSGVGDLDSAFDEYWRSFCRWSGWSATTATMVSFVRNQLQDVVDRLNGEIDYQQLDDSLKPGIETRLVTELQWALQAILYLLRELAKPPPRDGVIHLSSGWANLTMCGKLMLDAPDFGCTFSQTTCPDCIRKEVTKFRKNIKFFQQQIEHWQYEVSCAVDHYHELTGQTLAEDGGDDSPPVRP